MQGISEKKNRVVLSSYVGVFSVSYAIASMLPVDQVKSFHRDMESCKSEEEAYVTAAKWANMDEWFKANNRDPRNGGKVKRGQAASLRDNSDVFPAVLLLGDGKFQPCIAVADHNCSCCYKTQPLEESLGDWESAMAISKNFIQNEKAKGNIANTDANSGFVEMSFEELMSVLGGRPLGRKH